MELVSDAVTDRSTRRDWLTLCGVLGLTGVAGCLGGDDSDGDTDDTEPTADDGDESESMTDEEATDGGGDTEDSRELELEPEDGWKEPHDRVEVPDEPGTAILTVGGETVTLQGSGNGGELSDGAISTTGAELFEANGTFMNGEYRETEIQVTVTRMLGYEDTSGTWIESDSITFTRGDGTRLGTVVYRLYDDGRLATDAEAGELDGRRFVDEPFVHLDQNGVLTAVEEIESHQDDSLDGTFEFGARLQQGWDGA